jgi:hypothetical protein
MPQMHALIHESTSIAICFFAQNNLEVKDEDVPVLAIKTDWGIEV